MGPRRQSRREGQHEAGHISGKIKICSPAGQIIKHPGHTADRVTKSTSSSCEKSGEMRLRGSIPLRNMNKTWRGTRGPCCPHSGGWVQRKTTHRRELGPCLTPMAPVACVQGEMVARLVICNSSRIPEKAGSRNLRFTRQKRRRPWEGERHAVSAS